MEQADTERFVNAINQHGYGLQGALLRKLKELVEQRKSEWVLEATEFPVEVQGTSTRIDVILRVYQSNVWLVAECKRVNTDYNDWCFAKTRYIARNWDDRHVVETISRPDSSTYISGGVSLRYLPSAETCQVGITVKTQEKGKGSRDQIEEAATQVLRGVNGLVGFLRDHPATLEAGQQRFFLPVVFTTARLFILENHLTDASELTGDLDPGACSVKPVNYLYYQYHASPNLKHSVPPRHQNRELSTILQSEFVRTVAIVNVAGVEDFISRCHPDNLDAMELKKDVSAS